MKKLLSVCFMFIVFISFSQKENKENSFFTIRGNIGIPRVISSQMFRTSFAGFYESNLSFNIKILSNFYTGIGYQNTHFQNNKFLKYQYFNASIPYNTRLMCHGVFFKLGYDKFFSETGYASFALNSGVMLNNYFNVNADTSKNNKPFVIKDFSATYLQPETSVNFIVDKHLSFSIMLSYTTLFYKFDPKAPRFAHFQEIKSSSNNYFMGWFNFGFGINILIDKKQKE
jgi:hypothetical protein